MSRNVTGVLMTLFSPVAWRSYLAKRAGQQFDRLHGTNTTVNMAVAAMSDVDPRLASHAVDYEPSAIPKFRRALAAVQRALRDRLHEYSFVDFGSGKGLAVMLASHLPFKHVYGVEMSPALHAIAQSNLQKFSTRTPRHAPVTLECADALAYPWPDGHVVAYLYNPFDAELTARFIERLVGESERGQRDVVVAYVNPVHRELFDGHGSFREIFGNPRLVVYKHLRHAGR